MVGPLNGPIEVEVGQEFVIALESSPTTGYRWQFIDPLDEEILELVGSEYKGSEDERVGAGGEEVLTFRAISQGETRIAVGYKRPWERNAPLAKTRTFAVVVRPPSTIAGK
jgi:inhibitor of cysteine peptidase